ncbi:MAG: SIS domain-containing protein [Acidimicrobiia bacterium]
MTTGSLSGIDTIELRQHIMERPERTLRILDHVGSIANLPAAPSISNIVILGNGEAAMAGDMIVAVAGPFMSVPIMVHRGYELPSFVGPDSLVIALSASGETDETVEATEAAFEAGAFVFAVTGNGGYLANLGETWQIPMVILPADVHPRMATSPLAVSALLALEEIGFYPGGREWVREAATALAKRRDEMNQETNIAATVAKIIGRTFPLIYGAGPVGTTAALRWKHQFNLSAKIPAFSNSIPDMCHNEISGWGQHGDVTRQVFTRIDLRHDGEHPADQERFLRVAEMTEEVVADIATVTAYGEGTLAQLLDLMFVGDLCAVTLALAEGVDPGPIPAVEACRITVS